MCKQISEVILINNSSMRKDRTMLCDREGDREGGRSGGAGRPPARRGTRCRSRPHGPGEERSGQKESQGQRVSSTSWVCRGPRKSVSVPGEGVQGPHGISKGRNWRSAVQYQALEAAGRVKNGGSCMIKVILASRR